MAKPGLVDGRHYTTYVVEVRRLKREGQLAAAVTLLLRLVEATEDEARAERWGVAPWYYEQLAILYAKKKGLAAELAILERYERQPKAPGVGPSKLAERLASVRAKLARAGAGDSRAALLNRAAVAGPPGSARERWTAAIG